MKTKLTLVLAHLFILSHLQAGDIGSVLRDVKVSEIVQTAVPNLQYKSGNKDWSGGITTNEFGQGVSFDSNTAYAIYTLKGDSVSCDYIASVIRKYLVTTYKLSADKPGSEWTQKTPSGVDPHDYATVFLASREPQNGSIKKLEYITIQVTQPTKNVFTINLTYSTIR